MGANIFFCNEAFFHFSSSENHFPRFQRPYSPVIGGIFVSKSGIRFLFWALELPDLRVRKGLFSNTTFQYKYTPNYWHKRPHEPLFTLGKWFPHGEKWEKGPYLKKLFASDVKTYTFGIVLHFPIDWLKRVFCDFFFIRWVFMRCLSNFLIL